MLTPILVLGLVEGILRITWPGGDIPTFEPATPGDTTLRTPNPRVGRRYFAGESMPPAPPTDVFAVLKPEHTLRLFVLGASTAAGFPYPHNGTFSRVVRDALSDVLPNDSVEVVNVGIAATNSYTVVDLTGDVLAQHPDGVLIYAGHNEYYGALGVGSTIRSGSSPRLVRASLAAQRWRTVRLLRVGIDRVLAASRSRTPIDSTVATFMESVAADQQIELGGSAYNAGLAQFRENMSIVLRRFRDAGVPVFIASIASNERDQPPFVSNANGPARAAYDSGQRALAQSDSANARRLFTRARDLDVIRFRAPAAVNDTIRALAARYGAHYVPVAERFAESSPAGMTGHELFLEHVHPNRHGYALIGEAFVAALRDQHYLGRIAASDRLAPWTDYERRMELSPFDERIVHHTVTTITTRWPFVARRDAQDYRGTYRPIDYADSLALLVSRGGMAWAEAKLRLAARDEAAGAHDAALAEYRGLLRDRPFAEPGYRLVGRALFASGRAEVAVPYLERAFSLTPTGESCYLLGVIALQLKDYPRAITWLDRAVTLQPDAVASLYQLSLAFGLSHNVQAARGAAARAAQLDPRYPGLVAWMKVIGMNAP
ncbi:MAG: tetratricopeptide repeat protein [bacterium]